MEKRDSTIVVHMRCIWETIVSRTEESFVLVRSSYGVLSPSSSIDVIVSRYANKMEKDFLLSTFLVDLLQGWVYQQEAWY
ncbi:BnaC05g12710D [Brassica napus]|uniref:BnaC05g12710D protein n=1 Tax=Brassica napus TaxID=3708 RepID=A0A078HRZ5_BRANA|nr:BnaC05g12710D [Brassica napus]